MMNYNPYMLIDSKNRGYRYFITKKSENPLFFYHKAKFKLDFMIFHKE